MYMSYPDETKTQIHAIVFDHTDNSTTTADHNLTGEYELENANEIGWDCAAFRNV